MQLKANAKAMPQKKKEKRTLIETAFVSNVFPTNIHRGKKTKEEKSKSTRTTCER